MRKVILSLAVTLDGFIEGPNGEYDWCFTDQDYGLTEFFKRIDTMLIGRKSYELMLTMDQSVSAGFPKMTEYVFSTTLSQVKEGAVLIKENAIEAVSNLKRQEGKDIWLFGGAVLTTCLLNAGLVDELSLAVHPILLGSGKPLFNNIKERIGLRLMDTKAYESGLITLNYAVSR